MIILGFFSYFSIKTYVVGTHWKRLVEALPMSTHNICFYGELENYYPIIITKYFPLTFPLRYVIKNQNGSPSLHKRDHFNMK